MRPVELLARLGRGETKNVRFGDAQRLLESLGFSLDRIRGSHHLYRHPAMAERVNLQPVGGQAKPYQLRQVLQLIERYDLKLEDTE